MRVLRQRSGDEDTLLLATGKSADLSVGQFVQSDGGKRGLDRAGIVFCEASPPTQPQRPSHFDEAADRHRKIPIDRAPLGKVGNFGRGRCFAVPTETNRSSDQWNQPDECLKERRFTCAIGSEQGDAVAA